MSTNSRKAKKAAQLRQKAEQREFAARQLAEAKAKQRQRILHITEFAFGSALAIFGLVYSFLGPPWPTAPTFAPLQPSFGSPFDAPFAVSNKSILFGITDLAIECNLLELSAGMSSKISGGPGIIAARGPNKFLGASKTGTFTCPMRGVFKLDGIDAADSTLSAQISFTSKYDSPWFWESKTTSTSETFTLNTATMPRQWTPGAPLK
jgi:hypothetical protein